MKKRYWLLIGGGIILIGIIFIALAPKPVNIYGTGAINEQVNWQPNDPFVQLYRLLDLGIIKKNSFTITPVKKDRYIIVELTGEDKVSAKNEFNAWLKANNFNNIPLQKIKFR